MSDENENPVITEQRAELATMLATTLGLIPHPHMPALVGPGQVVVLPASPYLVPGETFNTFTLRLEASLVVSAVNNDTAATTLDALIPRALVALINDGWSLTDVSEPAPFAVGQARLLASSITVTRPITL